MLRMKKLTIILITIVFIAIPNNTFAAPAIDEIALNHETKQCGNFWSGDEFTSIKLPPKWVSFLLDLVKKIPI